MRTFFAWRWVLLAVVLFWVFEGTGFAQNPMQDPKVFVAAQVRGAPMRVRLQDPAGRVLRGTLESQGDSGFSMRLRKPNILAKEKLVDVAYADVKEVDLWDRDAFMRNYMRTSKVIAIALSIPIFIAALLLIVKAGRGGSAPL